MGEKSAPKHRPGGIVGEIRLLNNDRGLSFPPFRVGTVVEEENIFSCKDFGMIQFDSQPIEKLLV